MKISCINNIWFIFSIELQLVVIRVKTSSMIDSYSMTSNAYKTMELFHQTIWPISNQESSIMVSCK